MSTMTRDEARSHWKKSGLSFASLTPSNLRNLRGKVNKAMIASGAIGESYRAHQRFTIRDTHAALRCRAYYFEQREAITFNKDGFVGFAGWADDTNIQPILSAFCAWVDEMILPAPAH